MFFSKKSELINYINTKHTTYNQNLNWGENKRANDKIKKFVVFSHGLKGSKN